MASKDCNYPQDLPNITSLLQDLDLDHGPSQSGPYSRVRDLLATLTLNFSLIAARSSSAKSRGAQGIDRLAALG